MQPGPSLNEGAGLRCYILWRVVKRLTSKLVLLRSHVLVISLLDYCNLLLAWLPASASKLLQLIQNAAVRLVFNLPKFSNVTPSSVTCCSLHPIQDHGAGLQGCQQNCTCLPPNAVQTTDPSTFLYYISWLAGTTINESKKSPLSKVVTLLCFCTSVVEWTCDRSLDIFSKILKIHLFKFHLDPV